DGPPERPPGRPGNAPRRSRHALRDRDGHPGTHDRQCAVRLRPRRDVGVEPGRPIDRPTIHACPGYDHTRRRHVRLPGSGHRQQGPRSAVERRRGTRDQEQRRVKPARGYLAVAAAAVLVLVGIGSAATPRNARAIEQPSAKLILPEGVVSAAVHASATVTPADGRTVVSVAFEQSPAGHASWTTLATATAPPYESTLATESLPDGEHDFRVEATDDLGQVIVSPTVTRTVDNGPTISLQAPDDPLRGVVRLTADAHAAAGRTITSVEFELAPASSGSWRSVATTSVSPYVAALDTATLDDGAYDLRATATDSTGATTTSDVLADRVVANGDRSATLASPGGVVSGLVPLSGVLKTETVGVVSVGVHCSAGGARH